MAQTSGQQNWATNWRDYATYSYIELQPATLMSSNIRLQKTCQFCGERFTAKTTVTLFCSDNCAKRVYKQRKRDEKINAATKVEVEKSSYNPAISQKEFLTIDETCLLINASRWTIYRLIDKGELKAGKIGRNVRIPRCSINELLNF